MKSEKVKESKSCSTCSLLAIDYNFDTKLAWVFMGKNQKPYCEKGMISARSLLTRKGLSLRGI